MAYKILNFGTDPEVVILNPDGVPVASTDIIPGTKDNPQPIHKGCTIQRDNVLAEWTVPPTLEAEVMKASIDYCIDVTNKILPQGHKIAFLASAIFPENQLQTEEAKEFGCDPDFNAWLDGRENPRPKAANSQLRTCGGHLHLQIEEVLRMEPPSIGFINYIIKYLDLFLAVPSLLIDPDDQRRELYGKAGSYRPKPYGLEYRTLSNFWVNDVELIRWVMENSHKALEAAYSDKFNLGFSTKEPGTLIQTAINTNNKELANTLITKFNITLPTPVTV